MARMPAAIWEMTYSASRRKHSHRCRWCNRVIQDGEHILMVRVSRKKTYCSHVECAEQSFEGFTHRQIMEAWGMEYLAKVGWADARKWLDDAQVNKAQAA